MTTKTGSKGKAKTETKRGAKKAPQKPERAKADKPAKAGKPPRAAKAGPKPAAPRQALIPEDEAHTWKFFHPAGQQEWEQAGIREERVALDLSNEGIEPGELGLEVLGGVAPGDAGGETVGEFLSHYLQVRKAGGRGSPVALTLVKVQELREAAEERGCIVCGVAPKKKCVEPDGAQRKPHIERMRDRQRAAQANELAADEPAMEPVPRQVFACLEVACPKCTTEGAGAGEVGEPCAEMLDYERGLVVGPVGPCRERERAFLAYKNLATFGGDEAGLRRAWGPAAAAAAEMIAAQGVTTYDGPDAEPARVIYEAAGGTAESWPGWPLVRLQLDPESAARFPELMALEPAAREDKVLRLAPTQVEIIVDRAHPLLFCRRALRPPDPVLIGQIESFGAVREMVWITADGLGFATVDGRRRGLAARKLNAERLTAAVYALTEADPQGWLSVTPPVLFDLTCRYTGDPDRILKIKDTANHGREAEDLLRQADGVADLHRGRVVVTECPACQAPTQAHKLGAGGGLAAYFCLACKQPLPTVGGKTSREIGKLMGIAMGTVSNLLNLQHLIPEARAALEQDAFSVFCGYKLAKELPERQLAALQATEGIPSRERGAAIERFLSGDTVAAGAAFKTWSGKAIKATGAALAAAKDPEIQQIGRLLGFLAGTVPAKDLPKKWAKAIAAQERPADAA